MRSLTLTRVSIASTAGYVPEGVVGAVTVDAEDGTILAAVERKDEDAGVLVDVVALRPGLEGRYDGDVVASFSSPAVAPFLLPEHKGQVLDLHFFPDDRTVVVILAGGDIGTFTLGGDGQQGNVDIVGSVDSGIKAAAWSPDDEQLILVAGDDMLVCMTRNFDLLHEEPLRSDEFGEDAFINVGWGSKSTQFHGSLGKAAAKSAPASTAPSFSHPTDDGLPVITFRGDCAYFAISSLDAYAPSSSSDESQGRRQVRIYSRDAGAGFIPKLSATSESLPGLEGPLAWRPSGNVIASLVRYGYEGGGQGREGKWDVAMLERNGLRHGGFGLREDMETWEDGMIRGMSWNADSEVLAIWVERLERDVVQLWSMKNYHYYLKQEISSHDPLKPRFRGLKWHPEQALSLCLYGDDFVQVRQYEWGTFAASTPLPNDTATVAVVDGGKLLVTPFRTQNTPPPMSSYQLPLPSPAAHVSVPHSSDALAVLLADGTVQVYDLHTRLPVKGKRTPGRAAEPVLRWEVKGGEEAGVVKQVCMGTEGVAVLGLGRSGGWVSVRNGEKEERYDVPGDAERVLFDETHGFVVLDGSGALISVATQEPIATLPAHPSSIGIDPIHSLIFTLSPNGKLLCSSLSSGTGSEAGYAISSGVTSFVLTPDFIIYSTTAQQAHFAALPVLASILVEGESAIPARVREWETRRVERGALLVVAAPSEMSLVMQMPRGNLETVYPRPMVLAVVRRDVLAGDYRSAFLICRKHRLDTNVLYDLDPEGFMRNLEDFVKQVPEVDYLNLFVSNLGPEDSAKVLFRDLAREDGKTVPQDKVNSICDALRGILERELVKYVDTVLTTHVCKRPADYESGLRVLLQLQTDHAEIVEDAIKYIIFLSDVNQLYDVALGMYDFQLVLMVAQYSQKDPKEYLPFLRELRALDTHEQRFRIDDHLGRRERALRSLKEAGESKWDEASGYMARYELFEAGFELWQGEAERLATVHDLYGDYLYDRREFHDAATSYVLAGNPARAMKAYEKAHAWRELFALAVEQKVEERVVAEMVERVADHLASRGRSLEASRVIIEYAKDIDGAVDVLCRGGEFAEAGRVAHLHARSDLVESVIHPGLEDAQESLTEVFEEMEGQVDKELGRIRELMRLRRSDPDTFYLVDHEPDLEGVDVATNATTAVTNFTRYTVAPTTVFSQTTRMTGQTNKSRRKPSKRRQAGRKGTVDEWEYLLASLNRLVLRMDEKSLDAVPLLRFLVAASDEHRALARDLQATVRRVRDALGRGLEEAWRDREGVLRESEESGGMGYAAGEGLGEAREVKMGEVGEWKGLGPLCR